MWKKRELNTGLNAVRDYSFDRIEGQTYKQG